MLASVQGTAVQFSSMNQQHRGEGRGDYVIGCTKPNRTYSTGLALPHCAFAFAEIIFGLRPSCTSHDAGGRAGEMVEGISCETFSFTN